MTSTTTGTPLVTPSAEHPYAQHYAHFLQETREHRLTVVFDAGLRRQLRVAAPGTGMWSWSLITWPGYLATVGDVADGYLFRREEDMIAFMRLSRLRRQNSPAGKVPSIDYRYWAEKLVGRERRDVRRYDARVFTQMVVDHLDESDEFCEEAIAELKPQYADAARKRRAELLAEAAAASDDEHTAREWLEEHADLMGQDSYWESDLGDWDVHFLYACWAIELTIRLWDEHVEARGTNDDFVVVEGGMVQNDPALPVFDLDILGSDAGIPAEIDELLELRERILAHPNASVKLASTVTRIEKRVRARGDEHQVAELDGGEEE